MKRFPLSLPEDMHKQLRTVAFQKNSTMAEEIRKAIAEYLRKENDK